MFEVTPGKNIKIINIVLLIISIVFFILGVVTKVSLLVVMTLIVFFVTMYSIVNYRYERLIVQNSHIYYRKFLKRTVDISFDEIDHTEKDVRDNTLYMNFYVKGYSKKRPLFSINMDYVGADKLQRLAYSKKWSSKKNKKELEEIGLDV